LAKIEAHLGDGMAPHDVSITECQRCPKPIVVAANQLMALSGVQAMVPVSDAAASIHVVTWTTPEAEAAGMAKAIVNNIHAHPGDRHLVMVTRRQFGYWLRDRITELDPGLRVELGFSEGLLESWAAREAFLLFCLLIDPDPPTWRGWLGYQNSLTGKDFSAPRRSAPAYLRLLKGANDAITDTVIEALAAEPRGKARGAGGIALWDRAVRFLELRKMFKLDGADSAGFVNGYSIQIGGWARNTNRIGSRAQLWTSNFSERKPSRCSGMSRSEGPMMRPCGTCVESSNACGTRVRPTNRWLRANPVTSRSQRSGARRE
jgi:hypothetical protein